MPDLGQQSQNESYHGLLQAPGNVSTELRRVETGDGVALPLQISTDRVKFDGEVDFSGVDIVGLTTVEQHLGQADPHPQYTLSSAITLPYVWKGSPGIGVTLDAIGQVRFDNSRLEYAQATTLGDNPFDLLLTPRTAAGSLIQIRWAGGRKVFRRGTGMAFSNLEHFGLTSSIPATQILTEGIEPTNETPVVITVIPVNAPNLTSYARTDIANTFINPDNEFQEGLAALHVRGNSPQFSVYTMGVNGETGLFADSTEGDESITIEVGDQPMMELFAQSGIIKYNLPLGGQIEIRDSDSGYGFIKPSNSSLRGMYVGSNGPNGTTAAFFDATESAEKFSILVSDTERFSITPTSFNVVGGGSFSGTVSFTDGATAGVTIEGDTGTIEAGQVRASFAPSSLADNAATNGTIYYSTTAQELTFKDLGGVVRRLTSYARTDLTNVFTVSQVIPSIVGTPSIGGTGNVAVNGTTFDAFGNVNASGTGTFGGLALPGQPATRVLFTDAGGQVTSNAGLTFDAATGATLTSNVQDASSVSPALRTTVVSYRDSTPVRWTWFRGRLIAMNPPNNVPSLVFGNPSGPESSGFFGDGFGSIIGGGGVGVWTLHTPRAAWYFGAQLMASTTHLAWCPAEINSSGGDVGFIRDSLNTMRVTNASTGVGNLITGNLTVRQPGGTAGTNEVRLLQDANGGVVQAIAGRVRLFASEGNGWFLNLGGGPNRVQIGDGGVSHIEINSQALRFRLNHGIQWVSTNVDPFSGTADIGMVRHGTNTARITDGSTGHGDLQLRNLTASGQIIGTSGFTGGLEIRGGANATNRVEMNGTAVFGLNGSTIQSAMNRSNSSSFSVLSTGGFVWGTTSSAEGPTANATAGIFSPSGGTLEVTNGQPTASGGALRDLSVRNLTASGGQIQLSGTGAVGINGSSSSSLIFNANGSNARMGLVNGLNLVMSSVSAIGWCSPSTVAGGSPLNVSFFRRSDGVVELNNGTDVAGGGSLRDLVLRDLTASGTGTFTGLTLSGTAGTNSVCDITLGNNSNGVPGWRVIAPSGRPVVVCEKNSFGHWGLRFDGADNGTSQTISTVTNDWCLTGHTNSSQGLFLRSPPTSVRSWGFDTQEGGLVMGVKLGPTLPAYNIALSAVTTGNRTVTQRFLANSSTGTLRNLASVIGEYADLADATRRGRLIHGVFNLDTFQEAIRIDAGLATTPTTNFNGATFFNNELDVNAVAAGTHGIVVRTTGGGRALRVMSSDLSSELFSIDSLGIPTIRTLGHINFPHTSRIGDPNQIITGGGTGLGIQSNGSIFFASGGVAQRLTLDTAGNLTAVGAGTFTGLTVQQLGGTAGTDELRASHDGSRVVFADQNAAKGRFLFQGTGGDCILMFGGTTNLPALRPNGSVLQVMRADESNSAPLSASELRVTYTSHLGGWTAGADPSTALTLALSRFDDNTAEVNNGTRTASGGALRGLRASTVQASLVTTLDGNARMTSGTAEEAVLRATAAHPSWRAAVFYGATSQTAPITEWKATVGGAVVASVNASGRGTFAALSTTTQDNNDLVGTTICRTSSPSNSAAIFRGATGQSVDIQQWQTSTGAAQLAVGPAGQLRFYDNSGVTVCASILADSANGGAVWTVPSATYKGLQIRGAVSQTSNLQEWQNSAGAVLASVNSDGAYNVTLGSTSSSVGIRAAVGSGVNNVIQRWLDENGTAIGHVTSGNLLFFISGFAAGGFGGTRTAQLTGAGVRLASGAELSFVPNASISTGPDVAIRRGGVGVVNIDSGTAGDFRDLQVRNLTTSGTILAASGTANLPGIAFASAASVGLSYVPADYLNSTSRLGMLLGNGGSGGVSNDGEWRFGRAITGWGLLLGNLTASGTLDGLDVSRIVQQVRTSTTVLRHAGEMRSGWIDWTDATRRGRLVLGPYNFDTFQSALTLEGRATDGPLSTFTGQVVVPQGTVAAPGLLLNAGAGIGLAQVDVQGPNSNNAGIAFVRSFNFAGGYNGSGEWTFSTPGRGWEIQFGNLTASMAGNGTDVARVIGRARVTTPVATDVAGETRFGWADWTDASRRGYTSLLAYSLTTAQEGVRVEANPSGVRLGVLGATPVARQTVTGSRGDGSALTSLLTALANFGFVTDSTTTGGASSTVNSVTAVVDFGARGDVARVTVTGQTWVTPSSVIMCQVVPNAEHNAEELLIEQLFVTVENIVAGVGFDVVVHAPNSAGGQFAVKCLAI